MYIHAPLLDGKFLHPHGFISEEPRLQTVIIIITYYVLLDNAKAIAVKRDTTYVHK